MAELVRIPMKISNVHVHRDFREVFAVLISMTASVIIASMANASIVLPITLAPAILDGLVGCAMKTWTNAYPGPVCMEARVNRHPSREVTIVLVLTSTRGKIANRNVIVLAQMSLASMAPVIRNKV